MPADLAQLDDWPGHLARQILTDRLADLEQRGRRRRATTVELGEYATCRRSLAEISALYRARLRCEIEQVTDPLRVVAVQADELARSNLGLRCLNEDDLREIRDRWPDWTIGAPLAPLT